jgi:hypothetical protein
LLGEGKVRSDVGGKGFMIGAKDGDINPLTGDTLGSKLTAMEIEVWRIEKIGGCLIY